jgi:1-acyl-sn-glycerol-3-phosphate acyltransferase
MVAAELGSESKASRKNSGAMGKCLSAKLPSAIKGRYLIFFPEGGISDSWEKSGALVDAFAEINSPKTGRVLASKGVLAPTGMLA